MNDKDKAELFQMTLAYNLACEYDYCPSDIEELDEEEKEGITQETLDAYGGNRLDEISRMIVRKVAVLCGPKAPVPLSPKFLDWIKEKEFKFYFVVEDECGSTHVGFGYRTPGFIDDGWSLRDDDAERWEDYEYMHEVSKFLSHDLLGYECYSCSYEIEEKDIPALREYFLSVGMTEGVPAW